MFMNEKIINEIKKIRMLCNNEDYNNIPDDMIELHGGKNYAYVITIKNEKYIPGAIVLAESIHKLGSMAELVTIININFSNDAKEILKRFYDRIIEIEEVKSLLFRFEPLKLVEYKKIILINENSLILKYPDHLFTLTCPAMVYMEDEEEYINYDGNGEFVYEPIKWYKKYCECCSHGKKIKKSSKNKGIKVNLCLIQPNLADYEIIKKKLQTLKLDENLSEYQFLQKYHFDEFFSINPIFLGLNGYPHWSVLYGMTYLEDKPYILENKIPIEERVKKESYQVWYKFYSYIVNRYPELLDNNLLKETNEISKLFVFSLSRKAFEIKKILTNSLVTSVSNIFNIKQPKNSYYYHINISKEYDNETINYLLEDDFIQNMINDIIKKYNSLYWNKIMKKIIVKKNLTDNSKSNMINSNLLKQFGIEDKENIISQYAKINSNVSFIIVITTEKTDENFWLDNNLIPNILYQKNIEINGFVLKNILFDINQIFSYKEREKMLNSLYSDYTNYKLRILIYKTLIDCNLKGNNKDIYVFSDTNSKVRALSILFNFNTLNKFLNKEIIFIRENNEIYLKNILIFQSLKKWIYNNYDGNEMDNLIVINNFDINSKKIINKVTLIDINIYKEDDDYVLNNFNKNKLYFLNTIFMSKISKKSKLYNKYSYLIDNIHDSRYYYQLDGIKFSL